MRNKILLVDDVQLFLKLEETFFKRTGCEIFTADSGVKCLESALANKPDLIVLDLIMPDVMGDEVIKRLKSDDKTKSIPIIIVSTSADEKDIQRCRDAGAVDYVTKPINAQELLSKAAKILEVPHRLHYRIPVSFTIEGDIEGTQFTGISRNISLGGILVDCNQQVQEGIKITLGLPILDDKGTMVCKGTVVRVNQIHDRAAYLLGIQFLENNETQQKALEEFIKSTQGNN
jgi:CheY-like chemotaxis protein